MAMTAIASSSERAARRFGARWLKAILPGNQRNSARGMSVAVAN
jgi:hypothetical protein